MHKIYVDTLAHAYIIISVVVQNAVHHQKVTSCKYTIRVGKLKNKRYTI